MGSRELKVRMLRNSLYNHLEKRNRAYNTLSTILYCANDVCGLALTEAYDVLKKSPLFKHKIKQDANIAIGLWKKYEVELMSIFDGDDLRKVYGDLAASYRGYMSRHINTLCLSVLATLTRLQCPNRIAISHIVTAQTMLIFACTVFDDFFSAQENIIGANIKKDFSYIWLGKIRDRWANITHSLVDTRLEAEICKSPDYQLAVKCIYNQALREDKHEEIALETISKNKETVERRRQMYNI